MERDQNRRGCRDCIEEHAKLPSEILLLLHIYKSLGSHNENRLGKIDRYPWVTPAK